MNTLEMKNLGLEELSLSEQKEQEGGIWALIIVYNIAVAALIAQPAY
jgi:hypothetical protein